MVSAMPCATTVRCATTRSCALSPSLYRARGCSWLCSGNGAGAEGHQRTDAHEHGHRGSVERKAG
eukprot:349763-Chlamydomonas_euryale.AAC.8